ncbi:MAG: efflux RND transporter periplasmic adaptor subunit [Akkermansiaceae bacterium]
MKAKTKKILQSIIQKPRKLLTILLPLALFGAGWWFGLPDAEPATDVVAEESNEVWTCSMHPQIRQPNFGICPICEMDLIELQDSGEGGIREISVSPEASALLNLQVSPVIRSTAAAQVSLFGRIAYDERRVSTITSRIGGRIDRLFVDFTGARVRKGDHLAEIYSPEIYVAQRELIQATKSVKNQTSSSDIVRKTRMSLLNAAREKLRLLELSEDQIDAISQKTEPSDRITIRSPQDGIVVGKSVNQGTYVKTGDSLFKVADLSAVWLIMEAYESDLPWLRYAQDISFTVEAMPGEEFHGRIAFIDPDLDPVTRVAKVRVNVENPNQTLKPGMFASAHVESRITGSGNVLDPSLEGKWISPMHPEIIKDRPGKCDICGMDLVPAAELGFISQAGESESLPLLIPASAVLQTGERSVVYVRLPEKNEPTFEGREIVLGSKVGKQFIVENGLSEGELVVSQGAFKLDSELQIKAKPSMMNPNAGLEELPADSAPEELSGQWDPVLRSLARLQSAKDPDSAEEALEGMVSAIKAVDQSALQPDTLQLWGEFSNRLLNGLIIAQRRLPQEIEQASRIATRSTEEAGRYLGLSSRTEIPNQSDPAIAESLKHLIDAYLPLSKALADDDPEKAKAAAKEFGRHSNMFSLKEDADYLQQNAKDLAAIDDIAKQRLVFQNISNRLIALIRSHGLDAVGSAYVVHCPMVSDGKGGDWISRVAEVVNPYFGDMMLNCGSVTATLSLGEKQPPPPSKEKMQDMKGHDHSQ